MRTTWTALMLYEDADTRVEALTFSDAMVRRFWSRYEFDFSWFSAADLENPAAAPAAAEKSMIADLIVFSLKPEGELPQSMLSWAEGWIQRRADREGVLAGLLDPAAGPSGITTPKYLYLRSLAHRAGMDYLIQVPEDIGFPIPNSLDSYAERAGQKTTVLDDILRRRVTPPAPRIKQRIVR